MGVRFARADNQNSTIYFRCAFSSSSLLILIWRKSDTMGIYTGAMKSIESDFLLIKYKKNRIRNRKSRDKFILTRNCGAESRLPSSPPTHKLISSMIWKWFLYDFFRCLNKMPLIFILLHASLKKKIIFATMMKIAQCIFIVDKLLLTFDVFMSFYPSFEKRRKFTIWMPTFFGDDTFAAFCYIIRRRKRRKRTNEKNSPRSEE